MKEGLPELPEPDWRENRPTNPPKLAAEWYERKRVEAYGLACYRAGMERAAKVLAEDDINLLIGHAEMLRIVEGKIEMSSALFDLAAKIATARGDDEGAQRCRELAPSIRKAAQE